MEIAHAEGDTRCEQDRSGSFHRTLRIQNLVYLKSKGDHRSNLLRQLIERLILKDMNMLKRRDIAGAER